MQRGQASVNLGTGFKTVLVRYRQNGIDLFELIDLLPAVPPTLQQDAADRQFLRDLHVNRNSTDRRGCSDPHR